MSELNTADLSSTIAAQPQDDIRLADVVMVLSRYKRLLVGVPMLCAACAVAISFLFPKIYMATTRILPPQQGQSNASAMLSQLGMLGGVAGNSLGLKNPNDLYIGMLKSRTLADKLIQTFRLDEVYKEKSLESTRKKLEENTVISTGKDSLIVVGVEDEDPKRAAQIANAYVDELSKLTNDLAVTEASQRRLFFERELKKAKDKVSDLETSLKGSLDTHGLFNVDAESRAIGETTARLRAQIAAKEIQLRSMQAFVTPNNRDYKKAQEELASIRTEFAKLERGTPEPVTSAQADGQSGLANMNALRDLKYYQALYELLAKQYEAARLDEARESVLIQVLDKAVEPEHKIKPQRSLVAMAAAFLGLLVVVLGVAYRQMREGWSNQPSYKMKSR